MYAYRGSGVDPSVIPTETLSDQRMLGMLSPNTREKAAFRKRYERKLALLGSARKSSKNNATHGLAEGMQAFFSVFDAPFRARFSFPFRSTGQPKRYMESRETSVHVVPEVSESRASSFVFSRLTSAIQSVDISRSDAEQRVHGTVESDREEKR